MSALANKKKHFLFIFDAKMFPLRGKIHVNKGLVLINVFQYFTSVLSRDSEDLVSSFCKKAIKKYSITNWWIEHFNV